MARAASKRSVTTKRSLAEQVDDNAHKKVKDEEIPPPVFSSGCSLLNIALAEDVAAAYPVGEMVNIIGDKSAGKTLLALTMAAEIAHNHDEFDIVYDDAEGSADQFNLATVFGQRFVERVKINAPSETVEQFSQRVREIKKPTVYFIDSYDSLTSEDEIAFAKKKDAARAKGDKTAGSYGQAKAKGSSELFRLCRLNLKKTRSILVVLSQVRENIGASIFEPKYRRNGGKALDHYAYHIIWLAVCKTLKRERTVNGKKLSRIVGQRVRANITKNKVTGKRRDVEFDTLYGYGVDDIGALLDFCIEHGATELTNRKKQISAIESSAKRMDALKNRSLKTWLDIEAKFAPERKSRFE